MIKDSEALSQRMENALEMQSVMMKTFLKEAAISREATKKQTTMMCNAIANMVGMFAGGQIQPERKRVGMEESSLAPLAQPAVTFICDIGLALVGLILDVGHNQLGGTWFARPNVGGTMTLSVAAAARYMARAHVGRARVAASKLRELLVSFLGGSGVKSKTPAKSLDQLRTWFGLRPDTSKASDHAKLSKNFVVVSTARICAVLRQMVTQRPEFIRADGAPTRGVADSGFKFNTHPFALESAEGAQGVQWEMDKVERDMVETHEIATVLRAAAGLGPNPPLLTDRKFICGPNWQLTPVAPKPTKAKSSKPPAAAVQDSEDSDTGSEEL